MADETISEKCETLYNKLNSFVTSVINRDVTPKISNLNTEVWGSNTQTGDSRIDTLESDVTSLSDSITNYCTDTGWVALTLASGFTGYDSATTPKVRKIGKTVQIRGAVKNTATITIDTAGRSIFTLPEQYRPSQDLVFTCQGSQMAIFTLTINSGGSGTVSRYRFTNSNSSSYPSLPAGQWLPFSATYFVE